MFYVKGMDFGQGVLIYGLGRSGRGAARFLAGRGIQACWHDQKPAPEDVELMQQVGFERGDLKAKYGVVVAAPGVPIDHPDLDVLRASGAKVVGEVLLVSHFFPDLPLVGITGTAGKGGTTVLVAQLLRHLGIKALEGGNIDPPLLDVAAEAEVAVVELSSFQLERVAGLRLPVAVITNLGVDHLDRHRTIEAYHAAKLNVTAAQEPEDVLVVPEGLNVSSQAQQRIFQLQHITLASGEQVLEASDLPESIHPANAAAAILAVEALLARLGRQVEASVLAEGLRAAQPIAGRFETVAKCGPVRFIEDSIATRTLAVESALLQAKSPIAWLVGGRDKGAELAPLIKAAQGRVQKVIAFGEDGQRLAQQLGLPFEVMSGETGDQMLDQAVAAGYQAVAEGGTVLLAPIGTSFDAFKDYKARGQSFRRAALALVQAQQTPEEAKT